MHSIDFKPDAASAEKTNARPLLQIDGLTKRFGAFSAVDHLSLDIHAGEFFALLGPSGCGKTTLLRLIAGFERPNAGRILLDGIDLALVPPYRRPLNMMFQNYALFPHMCVADNVAFGLRQEGLSKVETASRVANMLAMVKLEDFRARKPNELSGGQRQRVALARALVKRPRLLLLDEPLAALDKKLRDSTRFELMELQRQLGLTFIIVTHDQGEAMIVADRMGVMDRGRLMQVGSPADIYERPNSRWVAGFIGDANVFEGRVGDDRRSVEGTAAGRLVVVTLIEAEPRTPVAVAVRPERIRVSRDKPSSAAGNCLSGMIMDVGYLGGVSLYQVRVADGSRVTAAVAVGDYKGESRPSENDQVWLSFSAEAPVVLTR